MKENSNKPYVYFILNKRANAVKIGYSKSTLSRFIAL